MVAVVEVKPITTGVDLGGHRNNTAITAVADIADGAFNVWGNSLEAEHLPTGSQQVVVDGIPFSFPAVGAGLADNVRCAGQFAEVVVGRYDWLYLLASSERRAEDVVGLHFSDGTVDLEALRISDFWAAPAWFGETAAAVSPTMHYPHHVQQALAGTIWCQRVPVTRRAPLAGIRLPRNIAIHVFAATLCRCGVG